MNADAVGPEPAGEAIGRLPLDRIALQSLLTPSCGTGRLSPERERLIAGVLDTAARSTRDAIAALGAAGERISW
ncbi:MAG TPA: hypothetical protein VEX67_08045 [Solirubrobacteraceae bacterium]|nr:hypothetical protein [Solirubrobacteraceae bacterium]